MTKWKRQLAAALVAAAGHGAYAEDAPPAEPAPEAAPAPAAADIDKVLGDLAAIGPEALAGHVKALKEQADAKAAEAAALKEQSDAKLAEVEALKQKIAAIEAFTAELAKVMAPAPEAPPAEAAPAEAPAQ